MSDIVLGIRLTADGKDLVGAVKVSADEIEKLGASTKRAESEARRLNEAQKGLTSASEQLKNALRGVVGAFGLAQLISLTDQYTKFNAQLKLASLSQSEYVQSLSDVRRIATQAQSSLAETGVLYARITNAVRELGIAQRDVADITETISLALKASGATATESASAMLQLSQAFGSGVLRGEEFNAVNEAAPRLMRALADGIGVPVGRLREMAEAGKLTSEVMANALPRALNDLRKEAASVQTIAGAFQVLKNNVMEFVGGGAQANGAAQALASSIGLLAENLALLAGVALTVAASKLAQWAVASAAAIYSNVAASRAAALATLEAARADVVATGSAATLTAARLAELRAVVIAAEGNVALAITTNGLVPAQAAATAASAAHTAALSALTVAQRGASIAATAGSAALAFLGGPIGAVTVALGLAATAWAVWGRSARDANAQAKDSTVTTSDEILAALEVQNNKLRERIALSKAGNADAAREGGPAAEKLASTLNEINALKAKGSDLTLVDRITLIDLEGRYNEISVALRENKVLTGEIAAIGQRSKAAQWAEEYATKAEKLTSTLAKARAELGAAFSPDLEKRIREKFAEKTPAGEDPLRATIKSLREKLLVDRELTEVAKLQITLEELSAAQRAKVTKSSKDQALAYASQVDAQKQANDAIKNTAENEDALSKMRQEGAQAQAEYDKQRIAGYDSNQKNIKQIQFETSLIGLSNEAREQAIALRAMEAAGIKKTDEAYASESRRLREALSARQVAQAAEDARKKSLDEFNTMWSTVESTGKQVWTILTAGGENMAKAVGKAIKASIVDLIYQLTARKWIINIGTSIAGSMGMAGAANAAGGSIGLANMGSSFAGSSFYSSVAGSGIGQSLGLSSVVEAGMSSDIALTSLGSTLGTALPYIGVGLAVASALGLFSGDGDAMRTGNWSAAFGQAGRSTENKWFDSSTGAGSFAADLAASEQKMADTLKLTAAQIAAINATLAARSGTQFNFGMEHTDWTQSGAAQAIQADRLKAIADALGTSIEDLTRQMTEAQKAIELAPKKRELEIQLMEAQGKTVEALAAKRADELAALDASLRPLQQEIYAAEDLATAANAAAEQTKALSDQLGELVKNVSDAIGAQIQASQSASQAARQSADAYRSAAASMRDAITQLRGGDLSPLSPLAKLNESRGNLDALFGQALSGDAAALARLPQSATDFLNASRAYNASSEAYSRDFARVMDMLSQAGVASKAYAGVMDYQATLLELQTESLKAIQAELAQPSPDAAILNEQKALLGTISDLLSAQTQQLITVNSTLTDSNGQIIAGNALVSAQTGQIVAVGGLTVGQIAAGNALVDAQTGQIIAVGGSTINQIVTGNALIDAQTGAVVSGNMTQDAIKSITDANKGISSSMLEALLDSAKTQSDYLTVVLTGTATTNSLLSQLITYMNAQADAAYQASFEKAAGDIWNAIMADAAIAKESRLPMFDQQFLAWKAAHPAPSHASGLAYVPYDDYYMRAHKGESVIDAPTMTGLRRYGVPVTSGGMSKEDAAAIVAAVKEARDVIAQAAEISHRDMQQQTSHLAAAVEDSANSMGRTIARAQEAGTRA